MYAVYHGPEGLAQIARTVHRRTAVLAAGLTKLGFAPLNDAAFRHGHGDAGERQGTTSSPARAAEKINLRIERHRRIGIALDETTTPETVEAVWRAFGGKLVLCRRRSATRATRCRPNSGARAPYLTHPVFHAHRSETEMLRYMRKLADRDLALDRAMIPLGSCTMKLNATTEMMPLTWPAFGESASVRAARAGGGLSRAVRAASKNGWPRSPAMTRSRCSRIPARRANMPGCWRSAAITPRAASRTATSA